MVSFDIGLFTCQTPPGSDQTPTERYQNLLDLGPVAEEAGFQKAWVSEHHFVEDGYLSGVLPFCAALGARTETLTVGTGIALAPFYDPIRFAEDCAVIDRITGGRFEAGVAIGWTDEEFEVFDVPKSARVAYTEELLSVLRAAGEEGPLTHDGEVFDYVDVDVQPKPHRPIPVWIAGTVDAAVRRAAERGDGYFATPTPLDELVRRANLARETAGDDSFPIAEWRYSYVSEEDDPWETAKHGAWYIKRQYIEWATGEPQPREVPAEMEESLREECLVGSPEDVREQVQERRDALGDDYRLVTRMTLPTLSVEEIRESMELFGEYVIDEL